MSKKKETRTLPLSIDTRALENRVRDFSVRKRRFEKELEANPWTPKFRRRMGRFLERLKADASVADQQCRRYTSQGWISEDHELIVKIRSVLDFCEDTLTKIEQRQPTHIPEKSTATTLSVETATS